MQPTIRTALPIAVPQGGGLGGGQRFDVSMTMNDSQWALPMLRRLVEAGNIDEAFVQSIREEMGEADDEAEAFSSETTTMVDWPSIVWRLGRRTGNLTSK